MKQSKLVGVIKVSKGMKETRSIMDNQYTYTRVRTQGTSEVVEDTVVDTAKEESVNMEIVRTGMTEEEREAIIKGIIERASAKSAILNEQARRDAKFKQDTDRLNRLVKDAMRAERKKYAPKTKLQAAMDMVGIDRRAVVEFLDQVEKRFM